MLSQNFFDNHFVSLLYTKSHKIQREKNHCRNKGLVFLCYIFCPIFFGVIWNMGRIYKPPRKKNFYYSTRDRLQYYCVTKNKSHSTRNFLFSPVFPDKSFLIFLAISAGGTSLTFSLVFWLNLCKKTTCIFYFCGTCVHSPFCTTHNRTGKD